LKVLACPWTIARFLKKYSDPDPDPKPDVSWLDVCKM
jgi:hypothetical protein